MSFSPVPISTTTAPLDPSKHVNYALGMILGVDDLNQEFAYLANRDEWIVRDLIGYGTVCGLEVTQDASDVNKGPSIAVSPGVSVNPEGQFIRVTPAQCAFINAWLNSSKISPQVASHLDESGNLTIYLNLCYRDCLTDSVPVPGEACRTEDSGDLLVPSRILDDFSLDFDFDKVDQAEEDGLRLFAAWMRQVTVAATGTPLADFLDALRTAAGENFANPPAASLAFASDGLTETLRAAFLVWTTEIRPGLRGKDADCVTPSTVECVMLSTLQFKVSGSTETGFAVDGDVTLDETHRPYLLHLRLLQEWLLTASNKPLVPDDSLLVSETTYNQAAAPGVSDHYARADHTHGTPPAVEVPTPDDTALVSETAFGQSADAGKSDHFSRADHTHGTPAAVRVPTPDNKALVTEITFGQAADAGKSTRFARADHTHGSPPDPIPDHKVDPAGHILAGDVAGQVGTNIIQNLQSQPVNAAKPADGQVLGYVKDHWEPVNVSGGSIQGSFVLRPPEAVDYAIATAGTLEIDGQKPSITLFNDYFGLKVDMGTFKRINFGVEFNIIFPRFDPKQNYIVKLTPWRNVEFPPCVAWVTSIDASGIRIGMGSVLGGDNPVMSRLMIEVSVF